MDTRRAANAPGRYLLGLALTLFSIATARAEKPAAHLGPPAATLVAIETPDASGPCTRCSTDAATPQPTFYLEPAWRGVALADLPPDVGFDAAALDAVVRDIDPMAMDTVASISLAAVQGRRLSLWVVGRAERFADDTTKAHRRVLGRHGLGIALISLEIPTDHTAWPTLHDFTLHEEHALADLTNHGQPSPTQPSASRAPRLTVSLVDRTLVLEIPALHMRRVFPVGVGALDPVRSFPALSSLTPTTERARVSKKGSHLALNGSSWARGLPYIPFEIPWVQTTPGPLSTERLFYGETRIAFHAWPGQTFMRGFNSHGCVTLRDTDLLELAAFVFGAKDPLPLVIRESNPDAAHPLPHENRQYWRLVNTGTADKPAFSLRGTLYHLERLREPIPDVSGLVGRFMDGERRALQKGRLPRTADAGIPESLIP